MKQSILNILTVPTKRRNLLAALRLQGYDITDRALRKTIEEMIVQDGELIQSSEQGYVQITTRAQMEQARKYLNEKIEALSVRRNCLLRNWNKKHRHEQAELLLF